MIILWVAHNGFIVRRARASSIVIAYEPRPLYGFIAVQCVGLANALPRPPASPVRLVRERALQSQFLHLSPLSCVSCGGSQVQGGDEACGSREAQVGGRRRSATAACDHLLPPVTLRSRGELFGAGMRRGGRGGRLRLAVSREA